LFTEYQAPRRKGQGVYAAKDWSIDRLGRHHFSPTQRPNSWTKFRQKSEEFPFLLFTVTSTDGFNSPHPLSKSGLKLVSNVNIVYGNLKTENSQDYAQNLN
jgi:hypothetical protein